MIGRLGGTRLVTLAVLLMVAGARAGQAQQREQPTVTIENRAGEVKVFDGTRLLASLTAGETRTVRLEQADAPRRIRVESIENGTVETQPERLGVLAWRLNISPMGTVALYLR